MGVISKLANIRVKGEFGQRLGNPVQSTVLDWFNSDTQKNPQQLLDEYKGYVYRCIDIIASNTAAVEIYMERKVGDEWQRNSNHPFMQFLEGDDLQADLVWMREGTTTYKKMVGEAFWYVSVGEQSRKPMGRLLLFGDRMQIVADDSQRVIGYKYTTEKFGVMPLEVDEVIHFKYFNPKNHLRGYGPLQAAQVYSDAEQNSMRYVNNVMENNGMPSGIIVLPTGTGQEKFDAFVAGWRAKYSGVDNAGKMAFLEGDNVDYKQVSSTLKDLQLDRIRTMTREDVLAMFGVSKHIIGLTEDSGLGRATAEAHEYIFNKEIIDTEVRRDIEAYDKALAIYYPQDKDTWRFNYVSPIPEDKDHIATLLEKGANTMTLNERRAMLNLEPLPDGNVIDVGGVPIQGNSLGKIRIKTVKKIPQQIKEVAYEQKEQYRLRIQDRQTKYEREYKKILKPFFDKQRNDLLDDIGAKKNLKQLGANLDPKKEADKMVEISLGLFIELVKEQAELAIRFAQGKKQAATDDFIFTEQARRYIIESLEQTGHDFTEQTLAKLSKTLTEGYQAGETLLELGDRIKDVYKEVEGYRLDRLTRTETLKTSNEANQWGYEQLGVTEKEWFANPDCCEFCSAMDGKTVGIQENYFARGETLKGVDGGERILDYEDIEHPPIHANCRCALLPVRV